MFNFIKQGIMKRVLNFRTILALAIILLSANGMFAQILTDYKNLPAETSYQTAGKAFRLYVLPDAIYSPLYNAVTNLGIDATAQWAWTYPAGLTSVTTSGSAQALNYIEFTNPAVGGPLTVSVQESNTVAICTGASVNQDVTIVAVPTAQFTTADIVSGLCGNQPLQALNVAITENVPIAMAGYAFIITEIIDNIDNAGAVTGNVTPLHPLVAFTTSGLPGKAKTGTAGFGGAQPDYTYGINSSVLTVQNAKRTQYTYTLTSPAGVTAGAGIVSAISQKSDYLTPGTITGYAFGAKKTVVFIVNPAPATGPIYHILNSYAY
jgi:hypothetical protein